MFVKPMIDGGRLRHDFLEAISIEGLSMPPLDLNISTQFDATATNWT